MIMKNFFQYLQEAIITTKGNLGISREKMPQIQKKDIQEFLDSLEQKGIKVRKLKMQINKLKPVQKEVNFARVKEKLKQPQTKPFIVSNDNYIIDGTHQYIALSIKDPYTIVKVYKVNLPIRELLKRALKFKKVGFKNIQGKEIKKDK